jgi:hypothetical protein
MEVIILISFPLNVKHHDEFTTLYVMIQDLVKGIKGTTLQMSLIFSIDSGVGRSSRSSIYIGVRTMPRIEFGLRI